MVNNIFIYGGGVAAAITFALVALILFDTAIDAVRTARRNRGQATVIMCEQLFALPAYRERND